MAAHIPHNVKIQRALKEKFTTRQVSAARATLRRLDAAGDWAGMLKRTCSGRRAGNVHSMIIELADGYEWRFWCERGDEDAKLLREWHCSLQYDQVAHYQSKQRDESLLQYLDRKRHFRAMLLVLDDHAEHFKELADLPSYGANFWHSDTLEARALRQSLPSDHVYRQAFAAHHL